jgi:FdhE protein
MRPGYEQRIARAQELAGKHPAAAEILEYYSELAGFQEGVFQRCRKTGATDVRSLLEFIPRLERLIDRIGPEPLKGFSTAHAPRLIETCWEHYEAADGSPEERFFAYSLLQPFAESLAARGQISPVAAAPTCPFCNRKPVAGVLRGEGDGGKRWLLCSLCATEWEFRRIICPNCGEEDKERLPVYVADELNFVRVEACDSCKIYLKSVDLTKNGLAVPVVDELATVALNLWAEEHGYTKLEPNILGM